MGLVESGVFDERKESVFLDIWSIYNIGTISCGCEKLVAKFSGVS